MKNLFNKLLKKKKATDEARCAAELNKRIANHQRIHYTDDPAFREITGSGFDNFLNDLQSILLDASRKPFEVYLEAIEAFYKGPESRAGNAPPAVADTIRGKVCEFLNDTYPEFFEAIEKSEQYIGAFSEKQFAREIFKTFLWILRPENSSELRLLAEELFKGLDGGTVATARIRAVKENWKEIIIVDGPVALNECAHYLCYDSELKFLFYLSPNDNYLHWTDYVYSFASEPVENLPVEFEISTEVPERYREHSFYFSESFPELVCRKTVHLSQL